MPNAPHNVTLVGERHLFTYPDYGTPPGYPQHVAHSGQECVVLQEDLDVDEEVEPLFLVQFDDGSEVAVYRSELFPQPATCRMPIEDWGWTVPGSAGWVTPSPAPTPAR